MTVTPGVAATAMVVMTPVVVAATVPVVVLALGAGGRGRGAVRPYRRPRQQRRDHDQRYPEETGAHPNPCRPQENRPLSRARFSGRTSWRTVAPQPAAIALSRVWESAYHGVHWFSD